MRQTAQAADPRLEGASAILDFPPPAKEKTDVATARSEDLAQIIEHLQTLSLRQAERDRAAEAQAGQQTALLMRMVDKLERKDRGVGSWLATAVAVLALAGSGMQWLASSGSTYGVTQQTIQRLIEDLKTERDARTQLQGRFDKLRDLYMVEFGADPEDPNTKAVRRKK